MATDLHPEPTTQEQPQSMTSLVSGIAADAQELLKQQMTLLKLEARQELQKTTEAAISLVTGLAVALVGAILLGFMLVHLLSKLAGPEHLWAWFGIVGGLVAGVGGGLITAGILAFRNINIPPEQTAEAIKETLEWQTKQK